jgi:cysteine synthase
MLLIGDVGIGMQVNDLNAIVVPVSGGGMLSGVATVVKSLRPDITVVAAEPTGQLRREKNCYSVLSVSLKAVSAPHRGYQRASQGYNINIPGLQAAMMLLM